VLQNRETPGWARVPGTNCASGEGRVPDGSQGRRSPTLVVLACATLLFGRRRGNPPPFFPRLLVEVRRWSDGATPGWVATTPFRVAAGCGGDCERRKARWFSGLAVGRGFGRRQARARWAGGPPTACAGAGWRGSRRRGVTGNSDRRGGPPGPVVATSAGKATRDHRAGGQAFPVEIGPGLVLAGCLRRGWRLLDPARGFGGARPAVWRARLRLRGGLSVPGGVLFC